MGSTSRLLWAMAQMFVIFGLQGYLQELVLQHTFQNRFALFITAVQYGSYSIFALAQSSIFQRGGEGDPPGYHPPWGHYAALALITGCSAGLTNRATQSLNYPTKVSRRR
jgi:hypothetical protein